MVSFGGMDMGGEEYNRLETRGVELWNSRQNSQRWDVYRYNNFAHNTLSFNHKYQDVEAKLRLTVIRIRKIICMLFRI